MSVLTVLEVGLYLQHLVQRAELVSLQTADAATWAPRCTINWFAKLNGDVSVVP